MNRFLSKFPMLLVVVVIAYMYFFWWSKFEILTVKVPRGSIKVVTLPDSSKVTLNAESSLKYNPRKWRKKREVILGGEAYFKIKLGKPFFVKTDVVITKTFGAKFNIKLRGKKATVSCVSGKVMAHSNQKSQEVVELESGFATSVLKDSVPNTPYKFNVEETIGWTTGEMKFTNTPLMEVFAEMERQFNINLRFRKKLQSLTFTGRIKKTDVNYALDFVSLAAGLRFDSVNDSTFVIY